MKNTAVTLPRHLLQQQQIHAGATGEFSILMSQISWAARQVAYELGRAGLLGILGATEEVNVQGEVVQKLDTIANDAFLRAFEYGELVGEVVSEEMEQPAQILGNDKGKYVVFVDPLDGSSNIDVNVTVGSIFSVHRRPKGVTETDLIKALQLPGNQQVAAGYALYGSSTMLVFTTGNGVHGFTLEPGLASFSFLTKTSAFLNAARRIVLTRDVGWSGMRRPKATLTTSNKRTKPPGARTEHGT